MAVKKVRHEIFEIFGEFNEVKNKVLLSMENGGFTSINFNSILNQYTANYNKNAIKGDIKVTLYENNEKVRIDLIAKAKTNNLINIFTSPDVKIINSFKNNMI